MSLSHRGGAQPPAVGSLFLWGCSPLLSQRACGQPSLWRKKGLPQALGAEVSRKLWEEPVPSIGPSPLCGSRPLQQGAMPAGCRPANDPCPQMTRVR